MYRRLLCILDTQSFDQLANSLDIYQIKVGKHEMKMSKYVVVFANTTMRGLVPSSATFEEYSTSKSTGIQTPCADVILLDVRHPMVTLWNKMLLRWVSVSS